MKKLTCLLLVALVAVSILGLATPANAIYEECETAAYFGWHSWGQNVACIQAIVSDIIGSGGWE